MWSPTTNILVASGKVIQTVNHIVPILVQSVIKTGDNHTTTVRENMYDALLATSSSSSHFLLQYYLSIMPPKSKLWEHFLCNKTLYKTNRTHQNAWCKSCVESYIWLRRDADTLRVSYKAFKMMLNCS